MTKAAMNALSKEWTKLRNLDLADHQNQSGAKVMPITIRTLESLIRLATAHAKLTLSKSIKVKDCKVAAKILEYSLFSNNQEDDPLEDLDDSLLDESENKFEEEFGASPFQSKKASPASKTVSNVKSQESSGRRRSKRISAKKQGSSKKSPSRRSKSFLEDKTSTRVETDLMTRFSKMKIKDDKTDLEREMDRFITMGEDVTADNTKFVFKKLIKFDQKIKDTTDQKGFTRDQFWKWLKKDSKKKEKGYINSLGKLKKALMEIETKGKIMVEEENDTIYLL